MFLFDEVVTSPERDQVSVVGGGWNGHTASTSDVRVTQLIGEHL